MDHEAECKASMQEYMDCLKNNQGMSWKCESVKRLYLQCRMEKGLMEEVEMRNLGLREEEEMSSLEVREKSRAKQQSGFIAGLSRVRGKEKRAERNEKEAEKGS